MTAGTVISIISAILAIARYFIELAQQKKWIDQGVAQAALQSLRDADAAIKTAQDARQAERDRQQRNPADILSDDGFRRPD